MSKIAVNIKIDVTKIDKARLFQGKKGTYLDAVAFIDLDNKSEYGDNGMVTQAVSKEEKDAGERGAILGNVTMFWRDDSQGQPAQQKPMAPSTSGPVGGDDDFDDDIPF